MNVLSKRYFRIPRDEPFTHTQLSN